MPVVVGSGGCGSLLIGSVGFGLGFEGNLVAERFELVLQAPGAVLG